MRSKAEVKVQAKGRTDSHLSDEVYLWVLSFDLGVATLFAFLWEITAVYLAM